MKILFSKLQAEADPVFFKPLEDEKKRLGCTCDPEFHFKKVKGGQNCHFEHHPDCSCKDNIQ